MRDGLLKVQRMGITDQYKSLGVLLKNNNNIKNATELNIREITIARVALVEMPKK